MIWANWSLDLITIGSTIYFNALFPQLTRTNVADLLLPCSDGNIWWQFLFGSYIPRCRLESVIAKYSKYPHRCSDWKLYIHLKTDSSALEPCRNTDSQPPRKLDNSARTCNSRFSNIEGDKEVKVTDCSFKVLYSIFKGWFFMEPYKKVSTAVTSWRILFWYH